jgi:hypothetical protein
LLSCNFALQEKRFMLFRLFYMITITGLLLTCKSDDDGTGMEKIEYSDAYRSLAWPIDCIPGETCVHIGLPDFDGNGVASNCAFPGHQGHQGTDISVTKEQMDEGVDVYAAADGVVLWVFDGKYDNCPGTDPDCLAPPDDWFEAGQSNGYRVCTSSGNYCGGGDCIKDAPRWNEPEGPLHQPEFREVLTLPACLVSPGFLVGVADPRPVSWTVCVDHHRAA